MACIDTPLVCQKGHNIPINAIIRHIVKNGYSHKCTNTCVNVVKIKLNTSFGLELKYNWKLTCIDTHFVCQSDHNTLIFTIIRNIFKYKNSHKCTNTYFYTVGTKLDISFGTKLK